MIYKIYYQPTQFENPKRENTKSLYLEASSLSEARLAIESNSPYNVEFIEELSDKALEYEKNTTDFKLTEF